MSVVVVSLWEEQLTKHQPNFLAFFLLPAFPVPGQLKGTSIECCNRFTILIERVRSSSINFPIGYTRIANAVQTLVMMTPSQRGRAPG